MQAKIGLAMLLKNFKFEVCKKTENPIQFFKNATIMLMPLNGIHLKVTKI
jgi:cytochrome P450 family 6